MTVVPSVTIAYLIFDYPILTAVLPTQVFKPNVCVPCHMLFSHVIFLYLTCGTHERDGIWFVYVAAVRVWP